MWCRIASAPFLLKLEIKNKNKKEKEFQYYIFILFFQGERQMKKGLLFLSMILLVCSMVLSGCGGFAEKTAATGNNVLRVGTEPIFAPFEFPKEGNQGYTCLLYTSPSPRD